MQLIIKILTIGLVIQPFFIQQSVADKSVKIQIVTEHAPPLNFKTKGNRNVQGLATELIRAVMLNAELSYQIRLMPWVRSYKKAMNEPNTLIYSIGRTKEREEQFKWIGEIMPMEYGLYRYTKNEPEAPSSLSAIKDKLIGVPRNDLRHQYLDNNGFMNLVFTNDYEQTFRLIKRGRIDYFVASTLGRTQFVDKYHFDDNEIKLVLGFEQLKTGLYFAFSQQTDEQIVEQVRKSFQNIKNNGTYDKIMGPLLSRFEAAKK